MPRLQLRAALILFALPSCAPAPAADLVVFGRVWTGDSTMPVAEAVAIAGDTIMAVGDSSRIARHIRSQTRVLSNGHGSVLPGFMDGHVHLLRGGYALSSIQLGDAATPEEFIARIKQYAAARPPGEWILAGEWDHERWPGSPLPERGWIDSVTPHNPVFVSRLDGHMGLANGLALTAAGIGGSTRNPSGGEIVRNPKTRNPTGVLRDDAQRLVYQVVPPRSPAQDDAALEAAMALAVSKGVTAVGSLRSTRLPIWPELAALHRAHDIGRLKIRVALYPALDEWRLVADSVKVQGSGDGWVRIAGAKGYSDGSLGATTALFFEPYSDAPGSVGLFVTPEDSLREWIGAADSAGLQVAVHAIGERANAVLLDIYDSVARAHGQRDRRFRIEHAQHLRPSEVKRIGRLGVVAEMQAIHLVDDGAWAEKRLGPERVRHSYQFRSLLDEGAHVALGSDWNVAPLDPLQGIAAAVTRRTRDGNNPDGWIPEQKVSVEEAVRMYTTGNAYGVFEEAVRGKLAKGYLADLVLLDADLFHVPATQIERVRVRSTVVGGQVVYEATDWH